MRVIIKNTYDDLSFWCALYIKQKINKHMDLYGYGKCNVNKFVLGLPTGSTPLGVYENLINFYNNGDVSFKNVITFNMDEYVGISSNHSQSYRTFMNENFFKYIDIPSENINLLNGNAKNLIEECKNYEKKILEVGGIDLFLCGVGRDGHIAFNEPGSSLNSVTRIKTLSEETIIDNARFFEKSTNVPKQALTVGIKTIMDSKEIIMLASGTNKANALKHCIEGSISNQYTCTAIQNHPKAMIICDENSISDLRYKTVLYYKNLQKNIDLVGLPLINYIQQFIDDDDKILITSPHPDDDVIGLGGTMQLFPNKDNVCGIVYMTNGLGGLNDNYNDNDKKYINSMIRIKEGMSSIVSLGYKHDQVIDANLPFYGDVYRNVTRCDINMMQDIIDDKKPQHIFVCIDEDPHKTHIKCMNILKKLKYPDYVKKIWLYKSAWEKWNKDEFNCTIHFPKDILNKKITAINLHISQQDLYVNNDKITSFNDITSQYELSHMCPEYYYENFMIVPVSDFVL